MNLDHLGWSEPLRTSLPPNTTPARICRIERTRCWALDPHEQMLRLPRQSLAVGDWVALRGGTIIAILPRRGVISRNAPGSVTHEQILAANVDLVLLMQPLDREANPGLVERARTAFPGIEVLVIASKADAPSAHRSGVESTQLEVSVVDGRGLDELRARLRPHKTAVLVGPSGAGKSSLANALLGEDALAVGPVREFDQKGRQTTTRRELRVIPGGGIVIDTPGLRVIPLWDADVDAAFDDIAELAARCRFADCGHETEPGCAVRDVVDARRLESWRKLQREAARQALRREERGRLGEDDRRRFRDSHRYAKERVRAKRGDE